MNIGIDLRALAAGKHTGVEEYTRGILQALFSLDRENQYTVFFNAWGRVEPDFSWLAPFPYVRLRCFRIPNKLLNLSLWYFRYPKLDRLVGGTDVFFMPNLNFSAFSRSTRVVVTAHDLSFERFPETFSWKQRVWHFLIHFRSLLARADRIVVVSQSTKDDLTAVYGLSEERIQVIPSGLDERFRPMSRNDSALLAVKEKYRLPYHFILYLGTLEPRKNIESLVEAFEVFHRTAVGEMAKYELVIAGTEGWKYQALLERIAHSPVREKIHRLGFVAEEDKPALYNLASLFIYPSLYEGFGFPPLEAMSCGVPVIASHSSSLPEVIGEAGILIDPYRPDEILQAMRQLLSDRSAREKLRGRGLEQRARFAWPVAASALLAEFNRFSISPASEEGEADR